MKKKIEEIVNKTRDDQEVGARKALLEELFYDFHRSRFQIYKINFIRGLFFGFGSALGGTVLLALLIWLTTLFLDTIPGFDGVFEVISNSLEKAAEQ